MQQTSIAPNPTAPVQRPSLRLFRPDRPATALGLAVTHLMTKPAFAHLRFGDWSRILVGQINRGHYNFVLDDKNEIVGFLGWAATTKDKAEAWVEGRGGFSDKDAKDGDCIVFNAWSANTLAVNRFLLKAARHVIKGKEMAYYKRHYDDGTTRPVRLRVNDFVEDHIKQELQETGRQAGEQ